MYNAISDSSKTKIEKAKKTERDAWEHATILDKVARRGYFEGVTFEQRPESRLLQAMLKSWGFIISMIRSQRVFSVGEWCERFMFLKKSF